MNRNLRKERIGIVTSNKMDKSIVVSIARRVKHDLYGKFLKYDTSNLKEKLKGLTFTSKLEKSGDLPMMRICTTVDNKENTFLDIRVKRGDYAADGTPYYRNIFEKGKQFTKLLSIIIEDED